MRKRRIRFTIAFIAAAIVVTGIFLIGKGQINNFIAKITKQSSVSEVEKNATNAAVETKKTEGSYKITLSANKQIDVLYKIDGESKLFTGISPQDEKVSFSINYTGNKIVIYDKNMQSMTLVDIDGTVQDLTKNEYRSTSGEKILKSDILNSKAGYVWCDSPVFISETKVAYISQLPWLDRTSRFVWIADTSTKEHSLVKTLEGESITFVKPTEKGLEINIDGQIIYLSEDGSVAE